MSPLNSTRNPIPTKAWSGAAIAFLAAISLFFLPGVANLGPAEISDAEPAKEIAQAEKTTESRTRRRTAETTRPATLKRLAAHAVGNPIPPQVDYSHDGHSLPNGLRAPLLC